MRNINKGEGKEERGSERGEGGGGREKKKKEEGEKENK